MTSVIETRIDEHVAQVILNRPTKRNAVNMAMFEALAEVGHSLAARGDIRVVVLSGEGPDFCAGIDTSIFAGGDSPITPQSMQPGTSTPANVFQQAACVWKDLPVPVVAAVNGAAFGAGLQIAAGADIRFAAANARFSVMEIKWGLIPDMGITTTLRHTLRQDTLLDLTMTGRIVAADEAQRLGLVTAIHDDPVAAALSWAKQVATNSPDSVRAAKRLYREGLSMSVPDALRLEAELQIELVSGSNQREAVSAVLEKRQPHFVDPTP